MTQANSQSRLERLLSSMTFILILWGTFVALYTFLKFVPAHDYSGWVGFSYYTIVFTTSAYYATWLWKNSDSTTKRILGYLALSFYCILSTALVYQFVFNVLRIPHSAMSNFLLSLYNVPYTGFLAFQLLTWGGILYINNTGESSRRPFLYIPVIIISFACLSLLFFIFDAFSIQHWMEERFLHRFYDLVQAILQIASFLAAVLCLAIIKNRGLFYVAISCLLITAVDTVLNFGILAQSYGTGSILEVFWILACLLSVYGLINFKKDESFRLSPKEWVCRLDDLRSQNTLWTITNFVLGTYIVSFLVYFTFPAGSMEGRLLQILISVFIFCLIFVVAMNNFFGNQLCHPLENMEKLIDAFMSEEAHEKPIKESHYPLAQFRRLEAFMIKAFSTLEQKLAKEKELTEVTSLVAHDVRKPFAKLKLMLRALPRLTSGQINEYSDDLDLTIRKVESMLSDIMETAHEVKYKLNPGNILKVLNLSIKEVSRYRPEHSVDFYYQLDTISLVNLDEQRIGRVFENIISNAFDFLPKKGGIMWFSVKEKNDMAEITLGNSHSHIPKDKVNEIFRTGFSSGKQGGTGLGLSVVTKVINGHNGSVIARNVEHASDFVPDAVKHTRGVEFVVALPIASGTEGHTLGDPILNNSREIKIEQGMINRKDKLAGSSKIDVLAETLRKRKANAKILILDDESIYRMHFKSICDKLSEIKPLTTLLDASSYKEAIEILEHTEIDYLICDIDLSDKKKDGFDILEFAKRKYPNCQVMMHTNRKEPEDISKAKDLGACGFCPKPMTEAVLVDLLLEETLWPIQVDESKKSSRRVIFLNDDRDINENTKLLMEGSSYALETFTDVRSALEFYRRTNNVYAILSDINLKGDLNGYDFLGEVRLGNKEIPFIIISGKSYKDEWDNARKMGATKYIQIPFKTEDLIRELDEFETK